MKILSSIKSVCLPLYQQGVLYDNLKSFPAGNKKTDFLSNACWEPGVE